MKYPLTETWKNSQITTMDYPSFKSLKKTTLVALLLLVAWKGAAQKNAPPWIDYQQRTASYPIEIYLTGFYSETGIAYSENTINRMQAAAQKQLIESVKVSIQSVGEVEIENVNRSTYERFKQTSTSVAEADLVGLQFETWYDKKGETAYAFAYAKKDEVLGYYQASLQKTLQDLASKTDFSQQMLTSGVLQSALEATYQSKNLVKKAFKAQAILLALGITDSQSLSLDAGQTYANKTDQLLAEALAHPKLQLDNVAAYFAHELLWQLGVLPFKNISLGAIQYENFTLESAFSEVFKDALGQKLVSIHGLNLVQETGKEAPQLTGNYRLEREKALITLSLTGNHQAAVEARIPLASLEAQQVSLLPDAVAKWQQVDALQLTALNEKVEAKLRQPPTTPLKAQLSPKTQSGGSVSVADIPLRFVSGKTDKLLCEENTGSDGLATCRFGKITTPGKIQIVRVEIDMPAYTGLPESHPAALQLQQQYSLPAARFVLQVSPLSVFVTSQEQNMGKSLDVNLIEPELKQQLAQEGFDFIEDAMSADFSIEIQANARQGNKLRNIHFSYVDATISLMDMKTGKEIYKDSFANIKGGGIDFEQAGIKAFSEAAKQIQKGVVQAFERAE